MRFARRKNARPLASPAAMPIIAYVIRMSAGRDIKATWMADLFWTN